MAKRRRNPEDVTQAGSGGAGALVGWLLAGGVFAGALYYGIRAFRPSTAVVPSFPSTGPGPLPLPGNSGGSSGGSTTTPSPTDPHTTALRSRLQASPEARRIFLFQSGMYSFGQASEIPDGVDGPHTREMITKINRATGNAMASAAWSNTVLSRLHPGLKVLTGKSDIFEPRNSVRVVPVSLSAALVTQVNADGLAVAADVPLLQIIPS